MELGIIWKYYQSTPSLTKRCSYVQGDTKPIVTPNEKTRSADSKRMLFVTPELGIIASGLK